MQFEAIPMRKSQDWSMEVVISTYNRINLAMTWHKKHSVVLILLALSWCINNHAWGAEQSNLLDGKSYVGKNGEAGQNLAEYEDEEIVFQDGMFTSISCEPYNFGSSPYNTKIVDGKIHFDAVTESPTHGKISWQGIIDGEDANVTFVWTKERWYWDTRREYWFHGKLKK